MHITIISNGHGEDQIAATIITAIKKEAPDTTFTAIPLVGKGHAFTKIKLKPALKNPIFPSGGFVRTIFDVVKDVAAGVICHLFTQRKTIKKHTKNADIVISIGDVFCLLWSRNPNKKHTYFLPTAKSDTFMPHSKLEKWVIRRYANLIFPRDENTHFSLINDGINSIYEGNPMMDDLLTDEKLPNILKSELVIGILPGSREEAYDNLEHICQIFEHLQTSTKNLAAISSSLEKSQIKAILSAAPITPTNQFKALINRADIIIGLAGTANEQAAFLGKPVICFEGHGPQSTPQRFKEQQKLMGTNIKFQPNNTPKNLAQIIDTQLKRPCPPLPKTNQNAAKKIAKRILKNYSQPEKN